MNKMDNAILNEIKSHEIKSKTELWDTMSKLIKDVSTNKKKIKIHNFGTSTKITIEKVS
jgi:hypothetical protein